LTIVYLHEIRVTQDDSPAGFESQRAGIAHPIGLTRRTPWEQIGGVGIAKGGNVRHLTNRDWWMGGTPQL